MSTGCLKAQKKSEGTSWRHMIVHADDLAIGSESKFVRIHVIVYPRACWGKGSFGSPCP